MTAAATTAPAAAPRAFRPADKRPRFGIWGALQEDARAYVHTDGSVRLQVLLAQQLRAFPDAPHLLAVLVWPYSPDPAERARLETKAEAMAMRMRCPCEVIVTGSGLVPAAYAGRPVGQLLDVLAITLAADVIAADHPTHHATGTTTGGTHELF